MNLAGKILKMFGWTVNVTVPDYPKCIICVAPHTSNWDFILGKLTYASIDRRAGFLMKSSWFFFPLGWIFRKMGGIPVYRKNKRGSLVDQLVERFNSTSRLAIAITPEGTRSRNTRWHTGFLQIAYRAEVPILLGILDYGTKTITISDVVLPTGEIDADLKAVQTVYRSTQAKYPEKFAKDNA
ncbi:MAG: 1-acyl-sn-glycerol-3-phosphate acyltransferase [Muribaculaceae bacterium]|nr:1-acyl-sn-glycerol-3-phosphate acyltransferase [Muribaculaceae bacterium]